MKPTVQLHKGREVCPSCGKKGVGYSNHQHAFGFKDYTRATCRYCRKQFAVLKDGER